MESQTNWGDFTLGVLLAGFVLNLIFAVAYGYSERRLLTELNAARQKLADAGLGSWRNDGHAVKFVFTESD